MMVRTQISLGVESHRHAKRRAAELGVSLSEYIRQLVARDLGELAPAGDVTRLFGLGESGHGDVASDIHPHVAAAVQARHLRRGE